MSIEHNKSNLSPGLQLLNALKRELPGTENDIYSPSTDAQRVARFRRLRSKQKNQGQPPPPIPNSPKLKPKIVDATQVTVTSSSTKSPSSSQHSKRSSMEGLFTAVDGTVFTNANEYRTYIMSQMQLKTRLSSASFPPPPPSISNSSFCGSDSESDENDDDDDDDGDDEGNDSIGYLSSSVDNKKTTNNQNPNNQNRKTRRTSVAQRMSTLTQSAGAENRTLVKTCREIVTKMNRNIRDPSDRYKLPGTVIELENNPMFLNDVAIYALKESNGTSNEKKWLMNNKKTKTFDANTISAIKTFILDRSSHFFKKNTTKKSPLRVQVMKGMHGRKLSTMQVLRRRISQFKPPSGMYPEELQVKEEKTNEYIHTERNPVTRQRRLEEMFYSYDLNGDGYLSKAELKGT